jgi:hypothetical protein
MIATIIGLVIAGITSIVGLIQWKKSNMIRKAEFLKQIIHKLRFDDNMTKTMYIIDYSNNWYNKSFHESDEEKEYDKFFAYLNYVCYLRNTRIISKKEFDILKYEINRVCCNNSVKAYLWNLYHFSSKNNVKSSFNELIEYGIKEKIIEDNFLDKNWKNYPKYLNF